MTGIHAYLNFDGNTSDALELYQECLGGDLQMQTFGAGDFQAPPATGNRVMHGPQRQS